MTHTTNGIFKAKVVIFSSSEGPFLVQPSFDVVGPLLVYFQFKTVFFQCSDLIFSVMSVIHNTNREVWIKIA